MAKSDYILKANMTYDNLREYEDILYKEVQIIDYLKCALLRNDQIDDFYIDDCNVAVYQNSNGYDLYFDDYIMKIDVYEKQIVGLNVEKDC